ncbi:hypothetical protein [Lichenihabitans psoromatis]|uniref:hypothetical protein n=1 Tax=Lichenihabitans psoromatis TaxID=2528642 RepID=UPI001FE15000|nr:hypothetical protein [Lichenihabitans psoromatis]
MSDASPAPIPIDDVTPGTGLPAARVWRPLRLIVAALLALAACAGVAAFRISGFVTADQLGRSGYLWSHSDGTVAATWVDGRVVPLLIVLGGGAMLFAVALIVTAWSMSLMLLRRSDGRADAAYIAPRPRRSRARRTSLILALGIGSLVAARWYSYVDNTATPDDPLGIVLNAYAPTPLRAWGCAKLRATFGAATVLRGCAPDRR